MKLFILIAEFLFKSHNPEGKCEIIFRDLRTSKIGIVEQDICKEYTKGQWVNIDKDKINWFR